MSNSKHNENTTKIIKRKIVIRIYKTTNIIYYSNDKVKVSLVTNHIL